MPTARSYIGSRSDVCRSHHFQEVSVRSRLRQLLAVLAVSACALSGAAPAVQAAGADSDSLQIATQQATPKADRATVAQVALAARSTSRVGPVVQFNYDAALKSGVAKGIADEFAGGIVAGGGSVINAPASVRIAPTSLGPVAAAISNCQGRNGFSTYWWGTQIQLDSCAANVVTNAMWGGAGVAAIAGIISSETGIGGAAGAVAAAAFTIGAAGLGVCSAWGTGIYVNQVWGAVPGCRAQ